MGLHFRKLLQCVALLAAASSLTHCLKPHDKIAPAAEDKGDDVKKDEGKIKPQPPAEQARVFHDPLVTPTELPTAQQQWWMEKTYRALTGKELNLDPEESKLRTLKRLDFVKAVMDRPNFVEELLSFNLYFLGFKNGKLRDYEGSFQSEVMAQAAALTGAIEAGRNGDYLKIFSFDQPIYLQKPNQAFLPDQLSGISSSANPSNAEIRAILAPAIASELDTLIGIAEGPEEDRVGGLCSRLFTNDDESEIIPVQELIGDLGLPNTLSTSFSSSPEWFKNILPYCFTGTLPVTDLLAAFKHMKTRVPDLIEKLNQFDAEEYRPRDLSNMLTAQDRGFTPEFVEALNPDNFYEKMINSSTNYDRRRASYVLKRYFCDDLTPISIAQPEIHSDNKHASDPSCQSCHYKLDPMAGFFRNYGFFGTDFTGSPTIIFDDGAQADLAKYNTAWSAPRGSGRALDVGYVRSLDNPGLNNYGDTPRDLFEIIKNARESKQCLVKRLFEYYVADNQVIDAGYLSYLTEKFIEESKANSSVALKRTMTRLAMSETFSEPDIVSSQCYDYAPGEKIGNRPPCRVNFLLQKHCVSCHNASGAAGGLDLATWTTDASFPHKKSGLQQDKSVTFLSIYDRLTTTDRSKRMPLDKFIPSDDREQIFLWVNDVLAALDKKNLQK